MERSPETVFEEKVGLPVTSVNSIFFCENAVIEILTSVKSNICLIYMELFLIRFNITQSFEKYSI